MTEKTEAAGEAASSHEQQMAAAAASAGVTVDGKQVVQPADSKPGAKQRPESVPEKFWNAEKGEINTDALLKSYGELEKKASDAGAGAGRATSGEAAAAAASPKVAAVLKAATDEIATAGKVSEATKALMEKAGIDDATVNLHVEALRASAREMIAEAFKAAGGEENYRAMIQWAAAALPAEEAQQFDTLLKQKETSLTAVKGLYARFQLEGGQEGKVRTGPAGGASEDVYRSTHELTAAVSDPRYKTDPAYRKEVEAKMVRSSRSGSVKLVR